MKKGTGCSSAHWLHEFEEYKAIRKEITAEFVQFEIYHALSKWTSEIIGAGDEMDKKNLGRIVDVIDIDQGGLKSLAVEHKMDRVQIEAYSHHLFGV